MERRHSVIRSSVAFGAQRCQAGTIAGPADHGQVAKKYEPVVACDIFRRKSVTIPKLRPPPPRQAQNRSAFCFSSQVSSFPSAVTIRSDSTASEVVPSFREARPTPPPSARPPRATVAHEPAGIVAFLVASAA